MTLLASLAVLLAAPALEAKVLLPVPVVRQARERCGPAALEMVLRYHGASLAALARPRTIGRATLLRRWRAAGRLAVVLRPPT